MCWNAASTSSAFALSAEAAALMLGALDPIAGALKLYGMLQGGGRDFVPTGQLWLLRRCNV
jgi:hypothetical protein